MPSDELVNNGIVGSPSKRSRFSKRSQAKNAPTSVIRSTGIGDSNYFPEEFKTGERRFCGALLECTLLRRPKSNSSVTDRK
jgi:hypothetical protein